MLVTNRGFDDPRVCMEAEALAHQGHALTVIGWDRDADRDVDQVRAGVRYVALRLRSTHARGITQPLFLAGFWWRAWRMVRRTRPSVIHCHDLDTLPLGWFAARRLRSRLVFDAHENYPDMMTGHLLRPAVSALRWLERHLVPRCDAVITVGERLAEHYRKLGGRKVTVVGNWKDPVDFRFPPEVIRRTRKELGLPDGVIAICFIANLGRERHLEPLLSAVVGNPRFACVVGGEGIQTAVAQRYAKENSNIFYLGRVSPERVPLITAACDVVYYGFDKTNPNARWSAPNNLYEAIVAGKPLLTNDLGEIGEIIRTTGCGVLADTQTAADIRRGLERLLTADVRREMGQHARALGDQFQRAEADRRLVKAYTELDVPGKALPSILGGCTPAGPRRATRPRVLVALSAGGFFRETQRAVSELALSFDVRYAVVAGEPYRTLWPQLAGRCHTLSRYDTRRCSALRNIYGVAMATGQAYRLLRDGGFRGVLTVGFNLAIPLGIAARFRGVPSVFVESISRVTRPSVTGRVLSLLNLADRIYVQWPEATALYRRARYEGNIF